MKIDSVIRDNNTQQSNSQPNAPADIDQLEKDLISMMLQGNQQYAISQLEADLSKLEKDLPNSSFTPDQIEYIQQAIQDAKSAIQTYQQTGTVDLNTLINALAEFETPLSSPNCSNDPISLAAMKQSLIILYSSELAEGILSGTEPGSSNPVYYHPSSADLSTIDNAIDQASDTLNGFASSLPPSIQSRIQQLCDLIQSGEKTGQIVQSPKYIALEAQYLAAFLNT